MLLSGRRLILRKYYTKNTHHRLSLVAVLVVSAYSKISRATHAIKGSNENATSAPTIPSKYHQLNASLNSASEPIINSYNKIIVEYYTPIVSKKIYLIEGLGRLMIHKQ